MKLNLYIVCFSLFVTFAYLPFITSISKAKTKIKIQSTKNLIINCKKDLISISADNILIPDIFLAISKKAGIKFIYNKNSLKKEVTFKTAQMPVKDAIKKLFKACGIKNYSIEMGKGNSIESVEILPELHSSKYIPQSAVEILSKPNRPDQEQYRYEEGKPVITHRKKYIAPETEISTEERADIEEKIR